MILKHIMAQEEGEGEKGALGDGDDDLQHHTVDSVACTKADESHDGSCDDRSQGERGNGTVDASGGRLDESCRLADLTINDGGDAGVGADESGNEGGGADADSRGDGNAVADDTCSDEEVSLRVLRLGGSLGSVQR